MNITGLPVQNIKSDFISASTNCSITLESESGACDKVSIPGTSVAEGESRISPFSRQPPNQSLGTISSSLLNFESALNEPGEKRYLIETERISEKNNLYDLDASYPQMKACPSEDLKEGFNKWVKSLVTSRVDEFVSYTKQTPVVAGMKCGYDIGYDVACETGRFISVSFYQYEYFAGTAHPGHNVTTFTYDLKTNREIRLSDLFTDSRNSLFDKGDSYIKAISDYCINDLTKQANSNECEPGPFLGDGAGPKEENFRNFNLTKDAMIIHFNEYQVASYAEGEKQVTIPYEALKEIINPAGPLGEISGIRVEDLVSAHPEKEKKIIEETDSVIIIDGVRLDKRS